MKGALIILVLEPMQPNGSPLSLGLAHRLLDEKLAIPLGALGGRTKTYLRSVVPDLNTALKGHGVVSTCNWSHSSERQRQPHMHDMAMPVYKNVSLIMANIYRPTNKDVYSCC